jgi:capsular exopolysaccharide synthesis family protein
MSRIFEALQRADLEQRTAHESETGESAEQVVDCDIEAPQTVKDESFLDNVVHHEWAPSTANFPTLADRGTGVEEFRSLRSRIYRARYVAPLKTILVSSGTSSEGKTFVVANLAVSLARNSANNVLLIDGDLRRPTLHSLMNAPKAPGLSEYLAGSASLNEIMQRDCNHQSAAATSSKNFSNLTLILSGNCGDNSSELVANRGIERLIADVSQYFDWILIDSPPVLAVADAIDLARAADAVLLIARGASTPYEVAQRAHAAFGNSRILGFVLNAVKNPPRSGSYYGYYGESEGSSHGKGRKE